MQRFLVVMVPLAFMLFVAGMAGSLCGQEADRQWTDSTGNFTFDARLIGYNDDKVILDRGDELVSIAIADLSDDDRKFLQSKRESEQNPVSSTGLQTWTLNDGLKVSGSIVDFAQRDVTVRSHLGKTFVNDRKFDNLPPVYQEIVPRIVSHFENKQFKSQRELESWLTWQPGKEKTYHCNGVLLELESGDRFGIPLFLFSVADQAILNPAFQRWSAAQNVEEKEEESTYLRAQTQPVNPGPEYRDVARLREFAEMQLQLQAYDAGLYDLWEVHLLPGDGSFGMRQKVVVPGRNSAEASSAAMERYPGYRIGGIAKVRRR